MTIWTLTQSFFLLATFLLSSKTTFATPNTVKLSKVHQQLEQQISARAALNEDYQLILRETYNLQKEFIRSNAPNGIAELVRRTGKRLDSKTSVDLDEGKSQRNEPRDLDSRVDDLGDRIARLAAIVEARMLTPILDGVGSSATAAIVPAVALAQNSPVAQMINEKMKVPEASEEVAERVQQVPAIVTAVEANTVALLAMANTVSNMENAVENMERANATTDQFGNQQGFQEQNNPIPPINIDRIKDIEHALYQVGHQIGNLPITAENFDLLFHQYIYLPLTPSNRRKPYQFGEVCYYLEGFFRKIRLDSEIREAALRGSTARVPWGQEQGKGGEVGP